MSYYGIPVEKKYPLNTEDEVRTAITHFNKCPVIKRKLLADNINERIRDLNLLIGFGSGLGAGNDFIYYIDKRYYGDIANIEVKASYKNMCNSIVEIPYSNKSVKEYNAVVYDKMIQYAETENDVEKLNDFLREANEYADGVTKDMTRGNTEFLIIMDIINMAYESLHLVSLQYNVSEEYVNKLLTDLEEMYVELQDKEMVKRKIFALNQYNTRCIDMKTDLNRLIGRKTKDLLDDKFTLRTVGKMSQFMLRYGQGNNTLASYLKDKQEELKEYYTLQNKYFFSGFNFHKSCLSGFFGDSYSMFETEQDMIHRGKDIQKLLKRYPKLTMDITYSDMYRLQKKFSYIKQLNVEGLSNVTIVSMNEGKIYFVTKKKKGDPNVFYLVSYDDLLNSIYAISGNKQTERWGKFSALKIILKSDIVQDEDFTATLESCTKF